MADEAQAVYASEDGDQFMPKSGMTLRIETTPNDHEWAQCTICIAPTQLTAACWYVPYPTTGEPDKPDYRNREFFLSFEQAPWTVTTVNEYDTWVPATPTYFVTASHVPWSDFSPDVIYQYYPTWFTVDNYFFSRDGLPTADRPASSSGPGDRANAGYGVSGYTTIGSPSVLPRAKTGECHLYRNRSLEGVTVNATPRSRDVFRPITGCKQKHQYGPPPEIAYRVEGADPSDATDTLVFSNVKLPVIQPTLDSYQDYIAPVGVYNGSFVSQERTFRYWYNSSFGLYTNQYARDDGLVVVPAQGSQPVLNTIAPQWTLDSASVLNEVFRWGEDDNADISGSTNNHQLMVGRQYKNPESAREVLENNPSATTTASPLLRAWRVGQTLQDYMRQYFEWRFDNGRLSHRIALQNQDSVFDNIWQYVDEINVLSVTESGYVPSLSGSTFAVNSSNGSTAPLIAWRQDPRTSVVSWGRTAGLQQAEQIFYASSPPIGGLAYSELSTINAEMIGQQIPGNYSVFNSPKWQPLARANCPIGGQFGGGYVEARYGTVTLEVKYKKGYNATLFAVGSNASDGNWPAFGTANEQYGPIDEDGEYTEAWKYVQAGIRAFDPDASLLVSDPRPYGADPVTLVPSGYGSDIWLDNFTQSGTNSLVPASGQTTYTFDFSEPSNTDSIPSSRWYDVDYVAKLDIPLIEWSDPGPSPSYRDPNTTIVNTTGNNYSYQDTGSPAVTWIGNTSIAPSGSIGWSPVVTPVDASFVELPTSGGKFIRTLANA